MPPARRKPSDPPAMPIQFVDTAAQMAGCVVSEIREDGKATRVRRYRTHPLETLHAKGYISPEERDAGLEWHAAWCRCFLSGTGDPDEPRVDRTPRPGDATIIQIEAMDRYAEIAAMVPGGVRGDIYRVAHAVCCEEVPIRRRQGRSETGLARNGAEAVAMMQTLQIALRALAKAQRTPPGEQRRRRD